MIWYLLYPLRGTTEPPELAPTHPLRISFARYGRYVARHVVTAVLISATVATVLVYPIPYLFTHDFVNGASYVPHHVWTVAQPITYDVNIEPDIIMKSIWVHSNHMEALDADLLLLALDLQNELLGDTENFCPQQTWKPQSIQANDEPLTIAQRDALHIANGLTPQSWFFHSPLTYWQYSRSNILTDPDILFTINNRKNQSNFANTTLRHSVVFSGKRFEDRRLVAADAIVITLFCLKDSPMARAWDKNAQRLPQEFATEFDIYPPDGRSTTSCLYEFQFRPMSARDIISLALAYGLASFYFIISLSKLRAVKSKFGLIITIITQIALSIMSSFTICAIFNFDLSRIPQAAYPLVVLSMSMENILRLINAVIITPFEDSTWNRIGYAFGQTALTALASSMQNVLILMGLSRVVSPGVSAFCIFAAVAIVFDFFYLSTFFLSVLGVDVRRVELGDALAKATLRQSRRKYGARNSSRNSAIWTDGLFQGKIAWSTRIAGTIIMVGFVIIAQWHFFGDDHLFYHLWRIFKPADYEQKVRGTEASVLQGLHQARNHASWIRNQDHESAQEVIRIIKPTAYSYVARVFEPLVLVKKNSDRTPHSKEPSLLPAAYDFIHHQSSRFVLIVVTIIAALRLLMNFLLWAEDGEEQRHNDDSEDPSMISIKSLGKGHVLDVAMLSKSKSGHIVSAGLDRVVRVWDMRGSGRSYVVADGSNTTICPFPILSMAIDDSSAWLALLSTSRVSFWNLNSLSWTYSVPLQTPVKRPAALFFDAMTDAKSPTVVMVQHNGTLVELTASDQIASKTSTICEEKIALARILVKKERTRSLPFIIIVSRRGKVHVVAKKAASWEARGLKLVLQNAASISQIVTLSPLGIFALVGDESVDFVDIEQGHIMWTFMTESMSPKSLQCTFSSHTASEAGVEGLASLTLCYVSAETGDCIVETYVPANDAEVMYFPKPPMNEAQDGTDKGGSMKKLRKVIKNPGIWQILSDGSVIGIRKITLRDIAALPTALGFRRRHVTEGSQHRPCTSWEVWLTSPCGKPNVEHCRSLFNQGEESNHLIVPELGPKVAVGLRSVAFAFGNIIKLVTSGSRERYGADTEDYYESWLNTVSRRRKVGSGCRRTSLELKKHGRTCWPKIECVVKHCGLTDENERNEDEDGVDNNKTK